MGSGGSSLSLRCDLDSVGELHSKDNFRQQVVTVETAPALFGGLGELEDHGQRGLVREAALGAHGAMTNRRECAFNNVRRAQMLPVLGREIVKSQQRLAILREAFDSLLIFDAPGLDEGIEG